MTSNYKCNCKFNRMSTSGGAGKFALCKLGNRIDICHQITVDDFFLLYKRQTDSDCKRPPIILLILPGEKDIVSSF